MADQYETIDEVPSQILKQTLQIDYLNFATIPEIAEFISKNPNSSAKKLICFTECDKPTLEKEIGLEVILWNEILDYDTYLNVWERAYSQMSDFLDKLSFQQKNALLPGYHDWAFIFQRALTYERAIVKYGMHAYYIIPTTFISRKNTDSEFSSWFDFLLRVLFKLPNVLNWQITLIKLNQIRPFTFRRFIELLKHLGSKAIYILRNTNKISRKNLTQNLKLKTQGGLHLKINFTSQRLKKLAQNPFLKGSAKKSIFICVEDSGTLVNLNPTIKILHEFRNQGIPTWTFTSSPVVRSRLKKENFDFSFISSDFLFQNINTEMSQLKDKYASECEKQNIPLSLKIVYTELTNRLKHFGLLMDSYEYAYRNAYSRMRPFSILTINETTPLAVKIGQIARSQKTPWVGFFPILLGKRPDCYFFPADKHLAYGNQLEKLMIESGIKKETIAVVGSPTYELHSTRSKTKDRETLNSLFPNKLPRVFLLATEAFNNPETELTPILRVIEARSDINLVIKLHPSDSESTYIPYIKQFFGLKNRVILLKNGELDMMLNGADLLLCIVSNIIIRAAQFETPCLSCDFSGRTRVLNFTSYGLTFGCTDPNEIHTKVDSILSIIDSSPNIIKQRLQAGICHFNGPNDGESVSRIINYILRIDARAANESPT